MAGANPTSNPIVGRVAFWTDDETCKLNINTAGDGTYYDTPRFGGADAKQGATLSDPSDWIADKQFALAPPLANEFQRYIGHPAQTRLSYVLPAIANENLNPSARSQIFSLISPFMQWGGSEGGLYTAWDSIPALGTPQRQTPYSSVDEWMFSTQNSATTTGMRQVEPVRGPLRGGGPSSSSPIPSCSSFASSSRPPARRRR